jgi:hypothetical protein
MTQPGGEPGFLAPTDLINKMKGRSQTDGWDIACAFNASKLNDVLMTMYEADDSKLVKTVSLGSQADPYSEAYTVVNVPGMFQGLSLSITENYTFELQQPALQFLPAPNTATVNMPIESAQAVTVSATLQLLDPQPANASELTDANAWYQRVGGTFRAATAADVAKAIGNNQLARQFYRRAKATLLDGDYQNKVYQLAEIQRGEPVDVLDGNGDYALEALVPLASVTGDGTITSGGDVVTFNTAGDSAKVVLHFRASPGSGTTFSLSQAGSSAARGLLAAAPDILDRVKNYFAQQVGEIDYALATIDSKVVGSGGIQLTPRSFRFATQRIGDSGTLTVFIQTHESGLDQGGSNLTFQDASNQPFLPVSSAANTTVIYSRAFMSRYYLIRGLTTDNFTGMTNSGTDNQPIAVTGQYNTNITISIADMYHIAQFYLVEVDPVAVGEMDVTIEFNTQNQVHVTSAVLTGNTTIHLYLIEKSPSTEEEVPATIMVTLDETIPLTWDEGADSLQLSFAITEGGYTVTVNSAISDQCGAKTRESVDRQIKDQVARVLPSIALPMGSLSAMAEENLLFNGQKVFALASSLGVHSPQDVVLFGNV